MFSAGSEASLLETLARTSQNEVRPDGYATGIFWIHQGIRSSERSFSTCSRAMARRRSISSVDAS